MLCKKCKLRSTCTELCNEAEKYVNQDYVPQTEYLPGYRESSIENYTSLDDNIWNRVNISKRKLKPIILKLSEDGKSTRDIACLLPCSDSYIRRIRRLYTKLKQSKRN